MKKIKQRIADTLLLSLIVEFVPLGNSHTVGQAGDLYPWD